MDLFIIILFFSVFLGIGFYFSKSNTSSSDYYKAGGTIPWPVAMFSIVATETSVLTFISVPSLAYRSGWWFLQLALGYIIGRLLVSIFLLPKYFSNDIISIYEVIGGYFGKPVQKLSSIIFLFTRLLADGIRFLATAIIFNILSGWGIVPSVFVIGIVTLIYSYFGGIRSILWIDSIQFVLYLVGGLLAMYFLYTNIPSDLVSSSIENSISSISYFDDLVDITNSIALSPEVTISYDIASSQRNITSRNITINFYSSVIDPDSYNFQYLWYLLNIIN